MGVEDVVGFLKLQDTRSKSSMCHAVSQGRAVVSLAVACEVDFASQ